MRARMTPEEMNGWMAYESIEPFWFDRLHVQLALIGSAIGNWLGAKVKPEHFMVDAESRGDGEMVSPERAAAMFKESMGGNGNR